MTIVLLVVAGALVAGWLRGGSLHQLSTIEFPGWPLVVIGLAAQATGAFAGPLGLPRPGAWYVVGMVLSAALVTIFVRLNRRLPGMTLVALGFACNALVVAANGAMPVSAEAATRAGLSVGGVGEGGDAKHELTGADTRLEPLADVIPVPLPSPLGSNVLSVGDIVLAAGIGVLVTNGMLRRRPDPA